MAARRGESEMKRLASIASLVILSCSPPAVPTTGPTTSSSAIADTSSAPMVIAPLPSVPQNISNQAVVLVTKASGFTALRDRVSPFVSPSTLGQIGEATGLGDIVKSDFIADLGVDPEG